MSRRAASWVAAVMLAIFVVGMSFGTLLAVRNGTVDDVGDTVSMVVAFTAFMAVGALIVARRPDNALGWVFSAIGLLAASLVAAMEYAHFAYLTSPGAPGGLLAAWYAWWTWYPTIGLALSFTLLLFPTGHLPSRRWRPLAWTVVLFTAAITLMAALEPDLGLQNARGVTIPNPIGVAGIDNVEDGPVGTAAFGVLLACMIAAVASLILRFRRAVGEERQQLKWFAYAGALVGVSTLLEDALAVWLPPFTFGLVLSLLPVSVGVAVLRYRLYAIDRLISRTVTYGLVTGLLAGLYAVGVVALGRLLAPITEGSQLAVAGSTLAVAAAFGPVRRRVQALVDRRFNRARYDAARTIDDWRARLRQELDLEELSDDLLTVVHQTMQPRAAWLWLRAPRAAAR